MRRREFITLLGGAAVMPSLLWPRAASAQPGERMRRIGVLNTLPADDPHGQERIGAFLQELRQAGWSIGGNVRVDQRWWAGGDADALRKHAADLVALAPDVILATGGVAVRPLLQATGSVPIVFTNTPDPVGAGIRRQPGAAERPRHRLHHVRIRDQREMAGAAQTDRARRDAGRGAARSQPTFRHRPVRRHPGSGVDVRGGGDPARRARRRRDRACPHRIRALLE